LEKSLHPDLYKHFLLLFLVNSKSSQLIATTHNRELLSNKDIIRNESIWFCDKSEASATKLYSLYNFDKPLVRDRINILNMYKAGIVGGIPHLGDYYIELSDEK
jgi:AAA15 family ATPase/GTPase